MRWRGCWLYPNRSSLITHTTHHTNTDTERRYSELPNQQAFFEAAKKSPRLVVHFYRPTTRYCQTVDAHLERLAARHLETRVGVSVWARGLGCWCHGVIGVVVLVLGL